MRNVVQIFCWLAMIVFAILGAVEYLNMKLLFLAVLVFIGLFLGWVTMVAAPDVRTNENKNKDAIFFGLALMLILSLCCLFIIGEKML